VRWRGARAIDKPTLSVDALVIATGAAVDWACSTPSMAVDDARRLHSATALSVTPMAAARITHA